MVSIKMRGRVGRVWTCFVVLLMCAAAGIATPLPVQASVAMMQVSVDTTPPNPPQPNAVPAPAGSAQPLITGTTPAVDPTIEYPNLIRSQSTQSALGNTLLGESIDYYTGETDFVATDISVPLNFALPMAVSRRYRVGNHAGGTLAGQFGDWDLDLPRIEVVLAQSIGWQVPSSTPGNQCSKFGAPKDATVTTGTVTTTIPASEYSQGYQLVVPGQGRRELLVRDAGNGNLPPGGASLYPVVTHDWWVATCETTATQRASGAPNEDFIVTSPDGVTYKFGYFTTRPYPSYQRIADDQTATTGTLAVLPRLQGFMLPDTIEDRFGNWVQYQYVHDTSYNYYVSKIISSDGHTITFTLNADFTVKQIENNTAGQGRIWKYTYTDGALTKVTLPDTSYWNIDFSDLDTASWTYTNATCTNLPTQTYPSGSSLSSSGAGANTVTGTLQHPSGASGAFTFAVKRQGRNSAPSTCLKNAAGTSFAAQQPAVYDVLSLTKKVITGPKLPSSYTWTLAYAGCTASSCSATKTTTVTDARGFDTTYTFGALYSTAAGIDTEGQVQKIQSGGKSGSGYLRTDSYTYFNNCGSSCPTTIGAVTQSRGDAVPLSTLKPIDTHTIAQDGATYSNVASNPDAYGFPQTITRTGTDTKTDTLTYHHDPGLWVIGTVTQLTSAGNTEFKIVPNSFDLPQELDRFGRKVATYAYNGDGTLHTVADNLSRTTTYSSYKSGIPQGIVYANNDSESAVVRYDGRITSWTDADGNPTSYDYDSGGRLKLVTYPDDTVNYANLAITWATPATGWTRTETAGSYTRTTTYDAFLDAVAVDENSTRYWANQYDADGRTTFASYAAGSAGSTHGTSNVFDGIGRLNSATDAANYATTYTPGKNALTVKDRDGNATTYTYKQYDTPSLEWPVTITTPTATTTIDRDTWGKAKQLTRGIVKRVRQYNGYQQLERATDTERSDILTFTYDDAGNVWKINRAGSTAETRGYDKRNRLTSITYANGDPAVSFSWWPSSAIKSQSRGSNSHAYIYNARHEIKTETITTDNGNYGLKYDYDTLAHLTTFTYPDATSIAYSPDVLGQPRSIGSFATGITFYPHGAVNAFSYGNGIGHSMTLTSDNRLLPYEVSDSAGVSDLVYTYDGNAFPMSITDREPGGTLSRTLHYDKGNRLDSATAAHLWGSTTFTYDSAGQDNLIEDATNSTDTFYTFGDNTNLPTSIKVGSITTDLTWDNEGNLKQKGSGSAASVFTFDTANELIQLVQGGTSYRYSYDGKGDRSTSSADTGSGSSQQTDSVYDAAGRLVYESASIAPPADRIFANGFQAPIAATQTTRYVYLGNHAIAKSVTAGSTTTTTYLHTDALGSPIAQTDAAKKVIGTSAHLPYGGLYSSTGTGNVAGVGYAGASADPTGLIYMHARYLDPQLHRFISLDPVDVDANAALNFNRMSYAGNNPYAKFDPSGRESVSTMIRNGAEGCGPVTCAFWAAGTAIYQFSSLGFANWHDQWRDAYDSGQISGDEYARIGIAGGGALALTGVAIGGTLSEVGGALTSELADASSGNTVMLRHYTGSDSAALIDASGRIEPGISSGKIWLTTDQYATAAETQSSLALPNTPSGYYQIPSYALDDLSEPSIVEPAYGQPGGGVEMTTDQAIDVSDISFTPFGD